MVSFKLKLAVLFVGAVALTILFLPSLIERRISVDNCTSCHALNASADSWKMSSHSKINCVKCHGATDIYEMPLHSVEIYQNLMMHYQGESYNPTIYRNLNNNICEQCHTSNRPITPSGDLIVPHDKHRAKNIACVRCHANAGHGETVQLKMTECMECHENRKVSHDCTVCHSNIQVPDTHLLKEWAESHGKAAFNDVRSCSRCHAYYGLLPEEGKVLDTNAVGAYAKGNPYCTDCHSQKPVFHETGWLPSHPFYTASKGMQNCLACHYIGEFGQKADASKPNSGYDKMNCNKCHTLDPDTQGEADCERCHNN